MDNVTCPKCGGTMQEGFIPNFGPTVMAWQPGPPEADRVLGLNAGPKLHREVQKPIAVFRCAQCAFLELYAK